MAVTTTRPPSQSPRRSPWPHSPCKWIGAIAPRASVAYHRLLAALLKPDHRNPYGLHVHHTQWLPVRHRLPPMAPPPPRPLSYVADSCQTNLHSPALSWSLVPGNLWILFDAQPPRLSGNYCLLHRNSAPLRTAPSPVSHGQPSGRGGSPPGIAVPAGIAVLALWASWSGSPLELNGLHYDLSLIHI